MPQIHFFTTEACEKHEHDSCSKTYEGAGIVANCICHCHKREEEEGLLTHKSKQVEQGRQSKLEEFGESIDNRLGEK